MSKPIFLFSTTDSWIHTRLNSNQKWLNRKIDVDFFISRKFWSSEWESYSIIIPEDDYFFFEKICFWVSFVISCCTYLTFAISLFYSFFTSLKKELRSCEFWNVIYRKKIKRRFENKKLTFFRKFVYIKIVPILDLWASS